MQSQYQSPFTDSTPDIFQQIDRAQIHIFDCNKCCSTFSSKSALKHHKVVHKIMYKCVWPECSRYFTLRAEFKKHMNAHKSEKFFPCSLCSQSFNNRERYQRHCKEHIQKPVNTCTKCPAKFEQKSHLRIHNEREHSRVSVIPVHLYKPVSDKKSKRVRIGETVEHTARSKSMNEPMIRQRRSLLTAECNDCNPLESNTTTESESKSLTTADNDRDPEVPNELLAIQTRKVKKRVHFASGTKGDESEQRCKKFTIQLTYPLELLPPRAESTLRPPRLTHNQSSSLQNEDFSQSTHASVKLPYPAIRCSRRQKMKRNTAGEVRYFTRSIKKLQDEIETFLDEPSARQVPSPSK